MEKFCKYFKHWIDRPESVMGYFGDEILCDNYSCVANNGKFFSAEIGKDVGFCNVGALADKLEEIKSGERQGLEVV